MAIAFTRTRDCQSESLENQYRSVFDPIVRPDMLESWEEKWRQWFVTTNNVLDQRQPGKVCFESTNSIIIFVI